jgi:hypothetical protein
VASPSALSVNRPVSPNDPPLTAEYLLAALRCARIRAHLLAAELDEIGVALKFGMIGADQAVEWIQLLGAVEFMRPSGGGVP